MKTKQQIIQEAYGKSWERVKRFVDKDGWCQYIIIDGRYCTYPFVLGFESSQVEKDEIEETVKWRPKSLKGIEINNGWIKCSEELPLDGAYLVHVCVNNQYNGWTTIAQDMISEMNDQRPGEEITHWRRVREFDDPRY